MAKMDPKGWIRASAAAFISLLYPPRCCICRGVCDPSEALCVFCCTSAERPLPGEVVRAVKEFFPQIQIEAAWSLWVFEKTGTLQSAHQLIKYRNYPFYGFALGRLLGHVIRRAGARFDAVTAVPLHSSRFFERGYNQCTPVATGVAEVLSTQFSAHLLKRTRVTRTQTRLSAKRRSENLRGAIRASADARDLNILVVDDVITSGATMAASADALIRAGAASVGACSLGFARR